MASVTELYRRLISDTWRADNPFSPDIEAAHNGLFGTEGGVPRMREVLLTWIQRYQPCLFGRIAAKLDLITFCILTSQDMQQSDDQIATTIQEARLKWTREAFRGRRSAFIVAVVDPAIANAIPNSTLLDLSLRLGGLYLQTELSPDQIYLDEVFLEKPGESRTTWRWYTGVNFFSAQGDGRWWRDHAFPGGMAFSVNSVGHLVKSGKIASAMSALDSSLASNGEEWVPTPVDSLEKALDLAMRTIHMATNTQSGRATRLVSCLETPPLHPCPIKLPPFLEGMNHCEYRGFYHTDETLPSIYFAPDHHRPQSAKEVPLDFTYLFHKDISNPAYRTMGEGRPIRSVGGVPGENARLVKANPEALPIEHCPRLLDALAG